MQHWIDILNVNRVRHIQVDGRIVQNAANTTGHELVGDLLRELRGNGNHCMPDMVGVYELLNVMVRVNGKGAYARANLGGVVIEKCNDAKTTLGKSGIAGDGASNVSSPNDNQGPFAIEMEYLAQFFIQAWHGIASSLFTELSKMRQVLPYLRRTDAQPFRKLMRRCVLFPIRLHRGKRPQIDRKATYDNIRYIVLFCRHPSTANQGILAQGRSRCKYLSYKAIICTPWRHFHTNAMNTLNNPQPFIRPSVVFSPDLAKGVDVMANAVKSTLGPFARKVGIERADRARMPELLDDAGVIARRIIQIENPTEDVGAMLLRHGMWRMHERIGDGAATMAVLAQAILRSAVKGVAAGMQPMMLRRGIEHGANAVVEALRKNARLLPPGKEGRAMLNALAYSLSADRELMEAIVAIVDTIGSEGAVELKVNDRRTVDYEFVEGATWNYGWLSPAYVTDKAKHLARQEDVTVVLLAGKIESEEQAIDGIERLVELDVKRVALFADEISEPALRVFTHLHLRGDMSFVLVKAPFVDADRMVALHDISALTGARALFDVSEFTHLTADDLGFARRIWSTEIKFGIIGGRRDGDAIRGRIQQVREAIATFNEKKSWDEIKKLRWRLAQLTGGTAVLQVGDLTKPLAESRKEHAERLIQVLQQAVGSGIVTGGGSSLRACELAVQTAEQNCADPDIRYGIHCIGNCLQVPAEVIAHNAGFEPSNVRAMSKITDPGHGFDVRKGKVVDMWRAGIVDSLPVLECAVRTAASVAAMIITTSVVVHQKKSYPGPVVP